jgi:hypothetical protein
MVHCGCQITFARLVAPLLLIKRLSFDAVPFLCLVPSALVPDNMISTVDQLLQWYFILEHHIVQTRSGFARYDLFPCTYARFHLPRRIGNEYLCCPPGFTAPASLHWIAEASTPPLAVARPLACPTDTTTIALVFQCL